MTGIPRDYPDRGHIQRIIDEVAVSHGVTSFAIACAGRAPGVVEARHTAIARILRETGCSEQGLSRIWGISDATIRNAKARAGIEDEPGAYDPGTLRRLAWRHGEVRACEIAAGEDPATNADVAAWRNLGRGKAA